MTTKSKTTTLRSQELSCPSCVAKIERELKQVKGVQSVDVRFNTGRIIVEHDPAEAGTDVLVDAVGRAGYTAKASAF
jgi:copper chaperone CopZ